MKRSREVSVDLPVSHYDRNYCYGLDVRVPQTSPVETLIYLEAGPLGGDQVLRVEPS